jgi:hypothetical protein
MMDVPLQGTRNGSHSSRVPSREAKITIEERTAVRIYRVSRAASWAFWWLSISAA